MNAQLIEFKIYCMEYSDYFIKSTKEDLENDRFKPLQEHINRMSHGNNIDNLIGLIEDSCILPETGLHAQTLNLISPRCIKPRNTVTEHLIEFLESNDFWFVLHNKLWKSPHLVEIQVEIVHEDDIFKYTPPVAHD